MGTSSAVDRLQINIGTANSRTGDVERIAFGKIQTNFMCLFDMAGGTNNNAPLIPNLNGRGTNTTLYGTNTLNGVTIITNLLAFTNAHTLHVRADGNDSTAIRGRWDKPWQTLSNAANASANGDTVQMWATTNQARAWLWQLVGQGAVNIRHKTNLTIQGMGPSSVLKLTNSEGDGIIISNCLNITLKDFAIEGTFNDNTAQFQTNGLTYAAVAWRNSRNLVCDNLTIKDHNNQGIMGGIFGGATSASNCIVRNCWFENIGTWYAPAGRYDGAGVTTASGTVVENCTFVDCGYGIEPYTNLATPRADDVLIQNNRFFNIISHAIFAEAGMPGTLNLIIQGNHIEYEAGHTRRGTNQLASAIAIHMGGGDNISRDMVIQNNTIIGASWIAIQVLEGVSGLKIANNYIRGVLLYEGIVIGQSAGAAVVSVENAHIFGNTIADCGRLGMNILGSNIVVQGNFIVNSGTNGGGAVGINIGGAANECGNVSAIQNTIFNTRAGLVNGIAVAANSPNTRLAGNIIYGQSGAAITDAGGETTLYTDTPYTKNGTNLLVGDRSWLYHEAATSRLITTNRAFIARNLYLGRYLSDNDDYASISHSNLISGGLGNDYQISLYRDGAIEFNAKDGYMAFFHGATRHTFMYLGDWFHTGSQTVGQTNFANHLKATNSLTVGPGLVLVTNILSARAVLDFPSTAAADESNLPITVTGTTTNDVVTLGAPWQAQMFGCSYSCFTSNNTVWVRFVNANDTEARDPPAAQFTVLVTKF